MSLSDISDFTPDSAAAATATGPDSATLETQTAIASILPAEHVFTIPLIRQPQSPDTSFEDANEPLFLHGDSLQKQFGFVSASRLWALVKCLFVYSCSRCGDVLFAPLCRGDNKGSGKGMTYRSNEPLSLSCSSGACNGTPRISYYVPASVAGGGMFLRSWRSFRKVIQTYDLTDIDNCIIRHTLEVRLALEQLSHNTKKTFNISTWKCTREVKKSYLHSFVKEGFPKKWCKEEVFSGGFIYR